MSVNPSAVRGDADDLAIDLVLGGVELRLQRGTKRRFDGRIGHRCGSTEHTDAHGREAEVENVVGRQSRAVIERCESDFLSLDHSLRRLQTQVKDLMATFFKIRDKMWYMTDVKNSMKYEEAKHVAMALKTMIYSARLFGQYPEEQRSRYGPRSLGGSLFQKPEVQVMNMMKAPSSQGGPNKLSDEQVELTRKWLSHNGIENFCKGEERIHRFCYEVRTSINKLVGETMAETPVLWASELFQRERSKYEGYGTRAFPGLSMPMTPRPSTANDETNHAYQFYGGNLSVPDPTSRFSQDTPSLGHKPSIQSIISDKWRPQRDLPSIDVSSLGGSPGGPASTSTGDTCSTFWSAPQRHPMYAASVSSAYSQPPSMFSETAARQTRRVERKTHGKTAFMDGLRQTLTSLLLSDLGSPVWSCGSETDAWFANALNQKRIQIEMRRRAAVQRFYADYEQRPQPRGLKGRRSRSLDDLRASGHKAASVEDSPKLSQPSDDQSDFSYKAVFHRLIEVFSRHGSPFCQTQCFTRPAVLGDCVVDLARCGFGHDVRCWGKRHAEQSSTASSVAPQFLGGAKTQPPPDGHGATLIHT